MAAKTEVTELTGLDAEIEAARALARASSVLERSSNELSLGHYRVLSAVASGHERASQVAAKLALGRPAVSAAVESLCERGLLTRSEVDEDHRALTLRLTGEGSELLGRVEGEMRERIREATSNLDLMTEARVNAAMDHVSSGRTTIIIAHRLQTARAADRIVVLDSGRIVETGDHDALLAAGGRYATMWESFETATTGAR